MNVEIGTEAVQFTGKEYINGIFLAVRLLNCDQNYFAWDIFLRFVFYIYAWFSDASGWRAAWYQ
jgi:hypothetical protein